MKWVDKVNDNITKPNAPGYYGFRGTNEKILRHYYWWTMRSALLKYSKKKAANWDEWCCINVVGVTSSEIRGH